MNKFLDALASTPLGSWFKAFLAFIVGSAVADWVTSGTISLDSWQTWVIGALAATIAPLINWLNGADARYGRGSADE